MPAKPFEFFDPAEDCAERSPHEILAHVGYQPLPPANLDDRQLPGGLWELLYAAAVRRFFFISTDHLNARAFYNLRWEQRLDEPTADIPLEAEANTTLITSELNANGMTHEEIWLRYYAEEADRIALAPGGAIPPHEDPPFDRDRFLPTPPIPLQAHAGWLPGDDDPPEEKRDDESDPLGLAAVDHDIAAAKTESALDGPKPRYSPNPALEAQLQAMEPNRQFA